MSSETHLEPLATTTIAFSKNSFSVVSKLEFTHGFKDNLDIFGQKTPLLTTETFKNISIILAATDFLTDALLS